LNTQLSGETRLERRIARLLDVGTWLVSAVIAIGLVLPSGARIVMLGIGLFVALPAASVAVLLHGFLRRGEYRLAMISALVLTTIFLGLVLGICTTQSGALR
jgi:uncharacterized membrane protein